MVKGILYIFTGLWAAVTALLIPQAVLNMDLIVKNIDTVLQLRIDPRSKGGEEIAHFTDDIGDDYGEGGLTYPRHAAYTHGRGYLDIIKFVVYRPLTNDTSFAERDFWQFAFTFADINNELGGVHGFSHPVIHLYIDIDGKKGGSTESAFGRCELVRFNENHPWDFMVQVDGFHEWGRIISYDGVIDETVKIITVLDRKTVFIRVPLRDKSIKRVLDGRTTYHYLLVGAYDQFAGGNFMLVKSKAGVRNGGGAASKITPRVFDYIPPEGMDQKTLLSSYNEDTYQYAELYPLEVTYDFYEKGAVEIDAELMKKYKKLAQEEEDNASREALNHLEHIKKSGNTMNLAIAYFQVDRIQDAEALFDGILESDPDNAIANAYKGSISAMKGGDADSIFMAMKYVNEAFQYLDRAVTLAETIDEKIEVYNARANTYMSIPENVFMKNKQAAKDFLYIAELLKQSDPENVKALVPYYINAGKCYETAGIQDEAEIAFLHAASIKTGLSASAKYELAKRGFYIENEPGASPVQQ